MKKSASATVDIRVWCECCRIRIAPSEERTTNRGKVYHTRCYSKTAATASTSTKTKS